MALPAHPARLPDPSGLFESAPANDRAFMQELVAALQRELDLRHPDSGARGDVILRSPDGASWRVSVDDTGALLVTRIGRVETVTRQ